MRPEWILRHTDRLAMAYAGWRWPDAPLQVLADGYTPSAFERRCVDYIADTQCAVIVLSDRLHGAAAHCVSRVH